MTWKLKTAIVIACALSGLPAQARAPGDIADLVGSRAPGAESDMQSRGYENIKNNTWWNANTKVCVKVHVSQGRYASISTVGAAACGQSAKKSGGSRSSNGKQCPSDLSQADIYKYPGCPM